MQDVLKNQTIEIEYWQGGNSVSKTYTTPNFDINAMQKAFTIEPSTLDTSDSIKEFDCFLGAEWKNQNGIEIPIKIAKFEFKNGYFRCLNQRGIEIFMPQKDFNLFCAYLRYGLLDYNLRNIEIQNPFKNQSQSNIEIPKFYKEFLHRNRGKKFNYAKYGTFKLERIDFNSSGELAFIFDNGRFTDALRNYDEMSLNKLERYAVGF